MSCPLEEHGAGFRIARQPRFEYAGAIHHVISRRNGGDAVYDTAGDRESFIFRLGKVCNRPGWKVSAWVLSSA